MVRDVNRSWMTFDLQNDPYYHSRLSSSHTNPGFKILRRLITREHLTDGTVHVDPIRPQKMESALASLVDGQMKLRNRFEFSCLLDSVRLLG
jgi:hypothetical protein